MNVSSNQNIFLKAIVCHDDIVIADTSATIHITGDLTSTNGRIYILGQNVIVNAKLNSIKGVTVAVLEESGCMQLTTQLTDSFSTDLNSFPKELHKGRHISANLQNVIITD